MKIYGPLESAQFQNLAGAPGSTPTGRFYADITNPVAAVPMFFNGTTWIDLSASGGGGTGTVTAVGLVLPAIFSVAGSPVTTSGTITATLATQAANRVWAGPTSGAAAAPTFRALVAADIPGAVSSNVVTKVANYTAVNFDVILCDATGGPFTISLPSAAATANGLIRIKKKDASVNAITIDGNGGDLIDGAATQSLSSQYMAVDLISDGANWYAF